MPLAPSTRTFTYSPTVLTSEFIVPFPIFTTGEVKVKVSGVDEPDFTLTAVFVDGRCDDAVLNLLTAVSGVTVEIYSARTSSVESEYLSTSPNLATQIMTDVERLAAVDQEIQREVGAVSGQIGTIDASVVAAQAAAAAAEAARDDVNAVNVDGVKAAFDQAWRSQRHLLTSDIQPRDVSEVARARAVLSAIATQQPKLDYAHVLGDLVAEGSLDDGAGAPLWGFPEFLEDWRTRIPVPLSRSFFMPGNHDRDGTGIGLGERAWTMRTFREWIGKEYFCTVQGNLLMIYLGDMGGSTGGFISNAVVAWMKETILTNADKNIILCLHQPLSGAYQGMTEVSDWSAVQAGSARISDVLTDVANNGADNIVCVLHGHSGSAFQFNDESHFGTRHLQIGMHIPSNVDNARNDEYFVMDLTHGASTFNIERWDSVTATNIETKAITWAYPLELGPSLDFDGRKAAAPSEPARAPQTVMVPLDRYRETVSTYDIDASVHYQFTVGVEDIALNQLEVGFAIGYGCQFPGSNSTGVTFDEAALNGVSVDNLGVVWRYAGGTDEAPDVDFIAYVADAGTRIRGYTANANGVHVGHTGTATSNPGNAQVIGATISATGYLSAHRDGITGYFGRATNGDLVEFNVGGSRVGVIAYDGTSTSLTTPSDQRLKHDFQSFDAAAVVMALAVYDHAWIGKPGRSIGVIAQEADQVFPAAVQVGGDDPNREPWMVKYERLVPVLLRHNQQQQSQMGAMQVQMDAMQGLIDAMQVEINLLKGI